MWALFRDPCDENVVRSGAATAPCSKARGRWILAATILASSMAFIDGTVVNVALPALQTNLNATAVDVQWVIESYALLLSALLLVGGSLGDHYGRRRIFLLGVAIFAIASGACGLAGNIRQLIGARAIQGFGAALLVPGSLAIISNSFSEQERGRAIGVWSGFSAMTTAIGPVLGGWLIEHVSWRAVFFINLPLALVVISISNRHIAETRDRESTRVDWFGAILTALGLGALVYGLIESSQVGFNDRSVTAALTAGVVVLILFLFSRWSGGLVTRYGPKLTLVVGPVVTALGYLLFLVPKIGGNYWTDFFPAVVVLGLGMAITVAPLTTTVMSSIPQHRAGVASGVNNAVARTASLVAIAVLGVVMLHVFRTNLDRRLMSTNLPVSAAQSVRAQSTKLAAIAVPENLDPGTQQLIRRVIDESFVSGFRSVMAIGAALAAASAVTALLWIGETPRVRAGQVS